MGTNEYFRVSARSGKYQGILHFIHKKCQRKRHQIRGKDFLVRPTLQEVYVAKCFGVTQCLILAQLKRHLARNSNILTPHVFL